jgi:hypothetical protein
MTDRTCAAVDCTNVARRRYCSDACASRECQQRYRDETHRRVDVSLVLDFRGPQRSASRRPMTSQRPSQTMQFASRRWATFVAAPKHAGIVPKPSPVGLRERAVQTRADGLITPSRMSARGFGSPGCDAGRTLATGEMDPAWG